MQIGQFNSISSLAGFSNSSSIQKTSLVNSNTNIYKSDSVKLNTFNTSSTIPKEEYTEPPVQNPKFFDSGTVRLAGLMLGSGIVVGGIGAGIGAAVGGRIAAGAAIGAGVGLLIPVGLIAYGLYSWGKN